MHIAQNGLSHETSGWWPSHCLSQELSFWYLARFIPRFILGYHPFPLWALDKTNMSYLFMERNLSLCVFIHYPNSSRLEIPAKSPADVCLS